MSKIKPPKGYRLLEEGEVVPKKRMIFAGGCGPWVKCEKNVWPVGRVFNSVIHAPVAVAVRLPRHAPPSAAACLRWLNKQRYIVDHYRNRVDEVDLMLVRADGYKQTFSGKSLLACIRAAMAAEKRGGK